MYFWQRGTNELEAMGQDKHHITSAWRKKGSRRVENLVICEASTLSANLDTAYPVRAEGTGLNSVTRR